MPILSDVYRASHYQNVTGAFLRAFEKQAKHMCYYDESAHLSAGLEAVYCSSEPKCGFWLIQSHLAFSSRIIIFIYFAD